MKKNIYIITNKIIEFSEISLSGAKYIYSTRKDKTLSWEFDVRLPMGYMLIGFKDFFLPYKKALLLLIILLLVILPYDYFISSISFEVQLKVLLTFLMMIAFALPSRYAYYSTNEESINKVLEVLYNLKMKNIGELELIEKNIESIYLRVQDRIKVLRWVISVCWIAYVFISKQIDISNLEGNNIVLNFLLNNILIMMYFLIPIIFVSIYKRGTSFLFQSILFALNDYKTHIVNKTNKPLEKTFLKLTKL